MPSDAELLLIYSRERDDRAFAELVRGHIDLVYSAALRRLQGDPHAAAEVTQEVFLSLARHAASLARHPVLNAWLHTATRNAAANYLRRERRHEARLQPLTAMHELSSDDTSSREWAALRGELDDAVDTLAEKERAALILRFFEGRSFVEIGAQLGLREEAARMRVTRALEKLRECLQRRGIVSTATALAGVLGTQAVSAAPAGLAASVATVVSAGVAATAVSSPALGLFSLMSLTKTSGTLLALAVLAGVAVVSYRLGATSATGSMPAATITTPALAKARPVETPAPAPTTPAITVPSFAPLATTDAEQKITALRDMLTRLPEQYIPEIVFVTDGEWHQAVDGKLESPEDFRRAMAKLRSFAQNAFAKTLYPAILEFRKAHNGEFITDKAQLAPYLSKEITPAMMQRYEIVPADTVRGLGMGERTSLTAPLIDSEYDNHVVIGPQGWGAHSSTQTARMRDVEKIMPAIRAYKAANGERYREMPALLPYATTDEQRAIIQRLSQDRSESP